MSDPPPLPPAPSARLAYATPLPPSRPGLVTAIGILSLCIGALSLLGNCVWMTEFTIVYGMMRGASVAAAMQASSPPTAFPATQTSPTTQAAAATQPSSLTPAQVNAVLTRVNALAGKGMNPRQINALRTALQAGGQQIIRPGGNVPAAVAQVDRTSVDSQGSVHVRTSTASIMLDPSGGISTTVVSFQGPIPALASAFDGSHFLPEIAISFLGTGLAIYLLVIGILTLRGSRLGGRLHRIYAWVKIVLALLGGATLFSLVTHLTGATASNLFAGPAFLAGVISAFIGLLYPIGLLIALRSRTLRAYYYGKPA